GNDCNNNLVLDECDIASGTSDDLDTNGEPDECQADCNNNTIPDTLDIINGTSEDCDGNSIPDECQPDCDNDTEADACELIAGTSQDCNGNAVPDECDITDGTSDDCNNGGAGNGIPDECEPDCNNNGVADECDIADGTSTDCDNNTVPDECDLALLDEDFESYPTGPIAGQGGWSNWDDIPGLAGDVSTAFGRDGSAQSLEIEGPDDTAYAFSGVNSGQWQLTAWMYIPAGSTLETFFILLNTYVPATDNFNFSSQIRFDSAADEVRSDPDGAVLPQSLSSLSDRWVELRVDIDLEADSQTIYVDGVELVTKSWTEGASGGGATSIGALDLYANGSDPVYYDDVRLVDITNDCNGNGTPDSCDIDNGTSQDCTTDGLGNGIPDECETDCNNNGISDACDIDDGTSADCDTNGVPDECDPNCDGVGLPDACELAGNDCNGDLFPDNCQLVDNDCNTDNIPDDCQLGLHFVVEDNGFSIDSISIALGSFSFDAFGYLFVWSDPDGNGDPSDAQVIYQSDFYAPQPTPGEFITVSIPETFIGAAGTSFFVGALVVCQEPGEFPVAIDDDATENESWLVANACGALDPYNLGASGPGRLQDFGFPGVVMVRANAVGDPPSNDCNINGVPDDCDPDCDGDDTPDDCEPDCDGDGTPDDCEPDCDGDGIPDDCESDCSGNGVPNDCEPDCNGNMQADDCDILLRSSADCNNDGIPDECQLIDNDCDG
ncbi:MAG: hypothetical protein ACYTHJ_22935, partial [Planctomycetota bacterium]